MAGLAFLVMLAIDVALLVVVRTTFKDFGRKRAEVPIDGSYDSFAKAYSGIILVEPDTDTLRFEYERAQEMANHFDNLNWQIGSILIGSNIIALGFLTRIDSVQLLFGAAIGGSLSLFTWILWFVRHRAMINIRLDRLYMIELRLGMAQHRMIGYALSKKWLPRVDGNRVALALFLGLLAAWLLVLA